MLANAARIPKLVFYAMPKFVELDGGTESLGVAEFRTMSIGVDLFTSPGVIEVSLQVLANTSVEPGRFDVVLVTTRGERIQATLRPCYDLVGNVDDQRFVLGLFEFPCPGDGIEAVSIGLDDEVLHLVVRPNRD